MNSAGVVPLLLISSPRFADHQPPPGHPECPERADVMDVVAHEWREQQGEVITPREATREQLERVHDAEYVRRISELAGLAGALDRDTYVSPETAAVASLAAGAAVGAVEQVMQGRCRRALALVRPPGHHAERSRAMGFCFYNNIAVAAAHARHLGAARVAIVDYDVHHGNGTQQAFEDDPSVLYVSTHQYPFYPGTGAADEIGAGRGEGFTVNLPLEVGAADEDYRVAFGEVIIPVLERFRPELVLVSAGFDAHERDPLAGMRLTTEAFAAMTRELARIADRSAAGRLVAITEGGYDLHALAESLRAVVSVLADGREEGQWPVCAIAPVRARAAISATKAALARFWDV